MKKQSEKTKSNQSIPTIFVALASTLSWKNDKVIGGGEKNTIQRLKKFTRSNIYLVEHTSLSEFTGDQNHIKKVPISLPFTNNQSFFASLINFFVWTCKVFIKGYKSRSLIDVYYSPTTNISDLFPSFILAKIFNKPIVSKCHISIYKGNGSLFKSIYNNILEEKYSPIQSFLRTVPAYISFFMIKKLDLTITITNQVAQSLISHGVSIDKIVVNFPIFEIDEYGFEIESKKYDLCFMSRIEKYKGIMDFLDLCNEISKLQNNFSAIIIGDGSMVKESKEYISKLKLKNITYLGYLEEERLKYVSQSKLFVIPSTAKEGFGMVLAESLACGTPVIAYKNPVFEEAFGQCQYVSLVKDYRDLVMTTKSILKQEINYKKIKQEGLKYGISKVDEEKLIIELSKLGI